MKGGSRFQRVIVSDTQKRSKGQWPSRERCNKTSFPGASFCFISAIPDQIAAARHSESQDHSSSCIIPTVTSAGNVTRVGGTEGMSQSCFHSAGPRGLVQKQTNVPGSTEGNVSAEMVRESFSRSQHLSAQSMESWKPRRSKRERETQEQPHWANPTAVKIPIPNEAESSTAVALFSRRSGVRAQLSPADPPSGFRLCFLKSTGENHK